LYLNLQDTKQVSTIAAGACNIVVTRNVAEGSKDLMMMMTKRWCGSISNLQNFKNHKESAKLYVALRSFMSHYIILIVRFAYG